MIQANISFIALGDMFTEMVADIERGTQLAQQQIDAQIVPPAINEIQHEPGKPKDKIRWTSAKQRRFVMMMLRNQNNIPYQRTGRLAESWNVYTRLDGSTVVLVFENPSPAAQFVYGSLNQRSRNEAIQFQQGFHQDTGWLTAWDVARKYTEQASVIYLNTMNTVVGDAIDTQIRKRSKRL